MDPGELRLIGEYIVGPKIGSGSSAVVWKARHRQSGIEVALKGIDKKKLLSPKVSENLRKEISVLSTINHPNIIRFHEAFETEEIIYLVLEYCDGGDLAAYIDSHGKVSETVARHFMRQLASGLQVLHEKHLIHRDLKPQNLLLSTNEASPVLKIGDFGFARSLTPQDLADTLCGSPLYMAPEIIQNQMYDAKADLWSVGAILFQLVTGKPPFGGCTQFQLFQNILASTDLQFPPDALRELHPDCVDLCRCLLRRNPVERITFEEFFNHKFIGELRQTEDVELSSPVQLTKPVFEQCNPSASKERPPLLSGCSADSSSRNPESAISSLHEKVVLKVKDHGSTSGTTDLIESIEKDYVLVNPDFASVDAFSFYLTTSVQDNSTTRVSICPSKKNDRSADAMDTKDLAAGCAGSAGNSEFNVSVPLEKSCRSSMLKELQGLTILHPSINLQLLHQYVHALSELAQEKYAAGLFLESFSIELVVLAIWKKAVQICGSWLTSTESELPGTSQANELKAVQGGKILVPNSEDKIDFSSPISVSKWAEQGFIVAVDRSEKLSSHIRDMDAAVEMPDAMEIIYQKALSVGTSGAFAESMVNKVRAAALYSKAMLLLSFIVGEASSLQLYPPFILDDVNKTRIQNYINNLRSRQSNLMISRPTLKQTEFVAK